MPTIPVEGRAIQWFLAVMRSVDPASFPLDNSMNWSGGIGCRPAHAPSDACGGVAPSTRRAVASSGVTGASGEFAASARVSLSQQTERLTDAYLAAVLPLEEYQRRRLELEQRQQGIAEQARQLEGSRGRHEELAEMVQSMEAFCQRVQQGLTEATFEQKRHLIELLIDRVVVTDGEVEIRYVIPTAPGSEQTRFCH